MSRRDEEARRQREKEARNRRRLQDEAYREAQRGVYARIYREQDAMPDDYEAAFAEEEPEEEEEFQEPREKRGKGKFIFLTLVLMLVALVGAALAAHAILVHRPELPAQPETTETEELPGPESPGAGRREDVYTFLLVGRDDAGGGNTDTIMVGCMDAKNGSLDVLSIYRDTLVDVPWEIKKINSVYNRQGIEGLKTQIGNLIGYQPDYYLVLEMDAVTRLVDVLGGVDFDVPYNMHYDDPMQDLHIHLDQGMQHLDGENAVRLLRWRKNNSGEQLSVGDVGRVEIQHQFLRALASQTLRLETLPKVKQIASIVDESITSDLTYGELLWFGEKLLGMDREKVRFHGLPGDFTGTIWSPTYQNYQSYVFVNPTALLTLVNDYMNPFLRPITEKEQHILHGTTVESETTLPESKGLPVIQEQPTGNEEELASGAAQAPMAPPSDTTHPSAPISQEEPHSGEIDWVPQPSPESGQTDSGEGWQEEPVPQENLEDPQPQEIETGEQPYPVPEAESAEPAPVPAEPSPEPAPPPVPSEGEGPEA